MKAASDTTLADRQINFRILGSTLLAFGLIANYSTTYKLAPVSVGDWIHLLAGPFFAIVMVMILTSGHEHLWSNVAGVRRQLGDESTTENRRRAQAYGFWVAILAGIVVYPIAIQVGMPGHKAAQLVATLALSGACLRFGWLEQKALRPA
jgi:succinate dehydrogenase hydrophobic anchor subunit